MDPFTQKRITKFIQDFRKGSGQLPTIKDLETAGFDRTNIDKAVKLKLIEEFYITLTNGTVVKAFKCKAL